jgi:peptidyl-prolyl cis-trans isomerase B (cyclophilin B)
MSSKQAKKQAKAERQARRAEAARQERRRNLASLAVVGLVVALGAGLIAFSLYQNRSAERQQAEQLAEMQSELAASEEAMAAELVNREVACGAERPAGVPAAGASEPAPSPRPSPDMVLEEGVDYAAVVETSCGTVRMDLAEDRAPQAVNAFVTLARDGFYDGLEIFRNATTIGALQTGSGTNDAAFDVGFTVPDELSYAQEQGYPAGAVAFANSGPDSAGSQFFFVYNDTFDESFADNRAYTRFATVTEGLDVLQEIGAIETSGMSGETPTELVYLESVEIVER